MVKKVFLVILAVIFIFSTGMLVFINNTFGNYSTSVYDIFINPILILLYLGSALGVVLLVKQTLRKKFILISLIPAVAILICLLWQQNLHKQVLLNAVNKDYRQTLLLFSDNTFEIKIQSNHVSSIFKGKFVQNADSLFFEENDIANIPDSTFDFIYVLIKNNKLEPVNPKYMPLDIMEY